MSRRGKRREEVRLEAAYLLDKGSAICRHSSLDLLCETHCRPSISNRAVCVCASKTFGGVSGNPPKKGADFEPDAAAEAPAPPPAPPPAAAPPRPSTVATPLESTTTSRSGTVHRNRTWRVAVCECVCKPDGVAINNAAMQGEPMPTLPPSTHDSVTTVSPGKTCFAKRALMLGGLHKGGRVRIVRVCKTINQHARPRDSAYDLNLSTSLAQYFLRIARAATPKEHRPWRMGLSKPVGARVWLQSMIRAVRRVRCVLHYLPWLPCQGQRAEGWCRRSSGM